MDPLNASLIVFFCNLFYWGGWIIAVVSGALGLWKTMIDVNFKRSQVEAVVLAASIAVIHLASYIHSKLIGIAEQYEPMISWESFQILFAIFSLFLVSTMWIPLGLDASRKCDCKNTEDKK